MSRAGDYPERPPSEQMADLHVYVVPTELWREHLNSAVNQIINDTVSAGFIRVYPELSLSGLRQEIEDQLSDIVPTDYIFLRSVGRCLTRVQNKQEYLLKVKNFLPPQAYVPEIYILEGSNDDRYSSVLSQRDRVGSIDRNPNSSGTVRSDKSSFSKHRPIPPIQNGHSSGAQTNPNISRVQHFDGPLTNQSPSSPAHAKRSQQSGQPGYDPPLSATPPAENGDLDGSDGNDQQRMQELLKRQREIDQRRAQHLKELDAMGASLSEEDQRWQAEEKRKWQQDRQQWEQDAQQFQQSSGSQQQGQSNQHRPHQAGTRNGTFHGQTTYAENVAQPLRGQSARMRGSSASRRGRPQQPEPPGRNSAPPADQFTHPGQGQLGVGGPQTGPAGFGAPGLGGHSPRPMANGHLIQPNEPILAWASPRPGDQGEYAQGNGQGPAGQSQMQVGYGQGPAGQSQMQAGYGQGPAGQSQVQAGYGQGPAGQSQVQAGYGQGPAGQSQVQAGYGQGPAGQSQMQAGYGPGPTGQPQMQGGYGQQQMTMQGSYNQGPGGQPNNQGGYSQPGFPQEVALQQELVYRGGVPQGSYNQGSAPEGYHPAGPVPQGYESDSDSGAPQIQLYDHNGQPIPPSKQPYAAFQPSSGDSAVGYTAAAAQERAGPQNDFTHQDRADDSSQPHPLGSPPESRAVDPQHTSTGGNHPSNNQRRHYNEDFPDQDGGNQENGKVVDAHSPPSRYRNYDNLLVSEPQIPSNYLENLDLLAGFDQMSPELQSFADLGDGFYNTENAGRSPSPSKTNEEYKSELEEELDAARIGRKEMEKKREELIKRAKQLQNRTQQRRNQARDVWKKKYFDEKKRTQPLEEQSNKLRQELENHHRRIMSQLEGSKGEPKNLDGMKPSPTSNMKIQATRLQHNIEELQRKVENIKMKLTSEMKLRNQAENELRALRAELTQKKINVTLSRSQQLAALGNATEVIATPRSQQATAR